MSSGHCTHPTGGPAIRLKHTKKKTRNVDSLLLVFSFLYYMIK